MRFLLLLGLLPIQVFAFINYQTTNSSEALNIFEGPSAVALGGAGLAAKSSNESGHVNPATLPLLDGTHFGFIYGSESLGPGAGSNKYHVVVSEATDEVAFPGAVTYSKVGVFSEGRDTSLQELHAGFGSEISDFVSLGFSAKYLTLESPNVAQKSAFNSTLGVLVTPIRTLGLAFVYDDMFDSKEISAISTTGLGAQYLFDKILRLRGDAVLPQQNNPGRKPIYKIGMETLFMGNDINVRLGYRWDEFRGQRFFGTGIGWQGPKLGLDYAYEKNALSEDYRHVIDMLLQF